MSRVLLVIGSVMTVLLTAALVLPLFVSWNGYRPLVEARLEQLLGRAVAIEGDLDVALLPRLRLRAADIAIGPDDAPIASIASADLVASLLAPVSAGLPIQSLTLRGLDAAVRFGPDGRPVLGAFEGADRGSGPAGIDPDTVSIDDVVIDGARLSVAVEAGSAPLVLEDLDATGRVTRLTGPWDLEGVLASGGQRFGWRINTGESRDEEVRVKARLTPLRPATERSDVAIVDAVLGWGGQSATRAPIALEGQVSLTSTPPRAAEGAGLLLGLPWRAEARLRLDPARVLLEELAVRLGPEEVAANLEGTASYAFGGARADMVLSARQIDVDRLFGDGAQGAIVPAALGRALLAELTAPRPDADGTIAAPRLDLGLEVAGLVAGGEVLRDLRLEAETLNDGRVRVAELTATLPGRAALRLSGVADPYRREAEAPAGPPRAVSDFVRRGGAGLDGDFDPADGGTFRGVLGLSGARPDVLSAWATGRETQAILAQPVGLRGDVSLTPAALTLEDLEADLGPAGRLSGTLAFGLGGDDPAARPWAARLEGESLGLDRIAEAPIEAVRAAFSRPFELDLDLGRLDLGPLSVTDLRAAASHDGRTLVIDELTLGDLGGAALEASGTIETARAGGTITLALAAERLDGLLALARVAALPEALVSGLTARATALVPLALEGAIAAAQDEAGARTSLRLEGDVGGTRTILRAQRLGRPGEPVRYAGFIDADAADSVSLFRQIGLPLDEDAARVAGFVDLSALDIAFEGDADAGTIEGALDAFGTRIDAAGTIALAEPTPTLDLAMSVESAGFGRLLDAVPSGLDLGPEPLPLSGEMRLSLREGGLAIEEMAATLDGARLTGRLALDERSGGGRHVDGRLALSSVSLPRLGAALLGVGAADEESAEAGLPTRPFAPTPLLAWREALGDGADGSVSGGIDVAIDRVDWQGSEDLSDNAPGAATGTDGARFRLSWPRDGLRIGDIEASLADGALTGRVLIARPGDGPQTSLSADLALKGAQLGADEENAPLRGALDMRVSLEGSGRSPAALVASLGGNGSALAEGLLLRDLAPVAFARTVEALEGREDVIEEVVAEAFREFLLGGLVEIDALEVPFTVSDGVLRVSSLSAEADALSLRARGSYDLARALLDLDLTLTPNAETPDLDDATARAVIAAAPSVGFSVSAEAPGEVAIDASALATAISVAGFERELGRLRALEEEILERARLTRELERQGETRRREADETASDPEEGGEAPAAQGASAPASQTIETLITDEAGPDDAEAETPDDAEAGPAEAAPTPAPAPPATRPAPRAAAPQRPSRPAAAPAPSQSDRIGRVLRDVLN